MGSWNPPHHLIKIMSSRHLSRVKSVKEIMIPFIIHNIYFQSSSCFCGLKYYFGGERMIIQIKKYLEYKKGW